MRPAQVYMPADQWAQHQQELTDLRTFRQQQQQLIDAKENERIQAMAQKGQVEEAMRLLQTRSDESLAKERENASSLQRRWLDEHRSRVINEALTGVEFVGEDPRETATMVRELLGQEVEAVLGGDGSPVVRDRATLRPAVDYLKERLKSPRFAIFQKATNRGGAGSDGSRPAATTQQFDPTDPNAAYQAAAEQYRMRMGAFQQARIPTPGQFPAG